MAALNLNTRGSLKNSKDKFGQAGDSNYYFEIISMSLTSYFSRKISNSWLSNRALLFCYFQQAMFIGAVFAIVMFKRFSDVQQMRCYRKGHSMPAEHITDRCGWSSLFTVVQTLEDLLPFGNMSKVAYPGISGTEGKERRSYLIYPYIPVL